MIALVVVQNVVQVTGFEIHNPAVKTFKKSFRMRKLILLTGLSHTESRVPDVEPQTRQTSKRGLVLNFHA